MESRVLGHNIDVASRPAISAEVLDVREGYSLWAACYDHDGNPLIAIEGPAMKERFGSVWGKRALDLGCGTGRHSRALAELGAQVTAIDMTPEMLIKAGENTARSSVNRLRLALPGPLPFRDDSFDLAVMGLVAEHLVELEKTLGEVYRVLVSGGSCLISTLHPDRTAEGMTARFIDPETGERRRVATVHREEVDYLAAAEAAGLRFVSCKSLTVPPELVERLPRAVPYVGLPLGWVGAWRKS